MGYLPYQLVQDFFHQQYLRYLSVIIPYIPSMVIPPQNGSRFHVTVTGLFSGCHLVRIVGLHRVNICHGVDLHFLVILGKKSVGETWNVPERKLGSMVTHTIHVCDIYLHEWLFLMVKYGKCG